MTCSHAGWCVVSDAAVFVYFYPWSVFSVDSNSYILYVNILYTLQNHATDNTIIIYIQPTALPLGSCPGRSDDPLTAGFRVRRISTSTSSQYQLVLFGDVLRVTCTELKDWLFDWTLYSLSECGLPILYTLHNNYHSSIDVWCRKILRDTLDY